MLSSSQLQSLIARNSGDISQIHREIAATAAMLAPRKYKADEYNKPFYSVLSRLQKKRKQLEQLQRDLKSERQAVTAMERASRMVETSNITIPPDCLLFVGVMKAE